MNQTTSLQLRGVNKKTPLKWRFSCNEIKKQIDLWLFKYKEKAEINCSYPDHIERFIKKEIHPLSQFLKAP